MSSRQAAVLASRVLCVLFLYWAFGTATSFPFSLFTLWLQWHMMLDPTAGHFVSRSLFRYGTREVEVALLRFVMELFLAVTFYRCGPRVIRFFTGGSGAYPEPSEAEVRS